jgi:hypothetical protein
VAVDLPRESGSTSAGVAAFVITGGIVFVPRMKSRYALWTERTMGEFLESSLDRIDCSLTLNFFRSALKLMLPIEYSSRLMGITAFIQRN